MAENLFTEFPPQSDSEWEAKILTDLKGKSKEVVESISEDGIKIQPNYFDSPNHAPSSFRASSDWKRVAYFDPKSANQDILDALKCGIDSLIILADKSTDLESLLKDVMDEIIEIKIANLGLNSAKLNSALAYRNYKVLTDPYVYLSESDNKSRLIQGEVYKNAGATIAQSISIISAQFTELIDNGATDITVNYAIGPDYFEEIAAIRALRSNLNQIAKAFESNCEFEIIGVPSSYYLSSKEENNNILRCTTMSMSGILGGVDGLITNGFKSSNEAFSNRISNNIQLILSEESYLNKVNDPSAGSYFIEYLTNEYRKICWSKFQNIEGAGGFSANLKNDSLKMQIDLCHMERLQRYASHKRILLGVNKYNLDNPDLGKMPVHIWNGIESQNISELIRKEIPA